MAKLKGHLKYMFDAAPASQLIVKDGVAKTASFNGPSIVLDELDGYWNTAGELADDTFAIAVNVTALDKTTGDEAYDVVLEFGPVGYATSIKTGKLTISSTGQYVILVDADTLRKQKADGAAIRLVLTAAGTTPSITLHAWIAGHIIGS